MRSLYVVAVARAVLAASLVLAACNQSPSGPSLPSFQPLTSATPAIQQAARAVVRIGTATQEATGSFISATGLLLTNNHVLGTEICPLEGCYAKLTFDYQRGMKSPGPQIVYVTPVAVNVGLDMAVVQVTSGLRGSQIQTPNFLTIASRDASSLQKTHVTLVGHPEGHLKQWTAGEVVSSSGDWITTSAYLLPGNSGSPILDDQGRLVGIVHRGPTGDDLYTSDGALTYSVGTPSALLEEQMNAPLPSSMISVNAATTEADVVASDIVYLNGHVTSVSLATGGSIDILTALGTACDAALAVKNYPTPDALSAALQPCNDAMAWIECRADATPSSAGTVCPNATAGAWQTRFQQINAAWVAMNGQVALGAASFAVASLASSVAQGTAAGAGTLVQALNGASQPMNLQVAEYLSTFAVLNYGNASVPDYVAAYKAVPDYELDAGDAAVAALWLVDGGLLPETEGLAIVEELYADPTVDVYDKLWIEDLEYQWGVIQ